jgi:hypothetical protein
MIDSNRCERWQRLRSSFSNTDEFVIRDYYATVVLFALER